uniref:Uncharacterized protein n=1 Tax=Amphimedon queenslandica TaxID=400682 RepID=A0A1X7U464_AMPQE
MSTPKRLSGGNSAMEMKTWLERCWEIDINWDLYPKDLTTINVYHGKGLSESNDLATFLSLFNGKSGMLSTGLSKAKLQILLVAALLSKHFSQFEKSHSLYIPLVITEQALVAAQNFVEVACQHAAFLAGQAMIDDGLKRLSTGGNEDGALTAMKALEADGLGDSEVYIGGRPQYVPGIPGYFIFGDWGVFISGHPGYAPNIPGDFVLVDFGVYTGGTSWGDILGMSPVFQDTMYYGIGKCI